MQLRIGDAFVVRTPVLSAQTLAEPLSRPSMDQEALRRLYQDPLVQEAIFLASPSLHDDAQRWIAGTLSGPGDIAHVERSLLKYLIRMSTRSTPFGLFAACSTGSFGDVARGELADPASIRRKTRLDMNLVCQLAQRLTSDPGIRPGLRFYPNTTLYALGPAIRYYEFWYDDQRRRHHRLVSIERNRYLDLILTDARQGARLEALAERITDQDVTVVEARQYLNDLVDNQVLVSELEPSLTDTELLGSLIERLPTVGAGMRNALERIGVAIDDLDDGRRNPPAAYTAIADAIDAVVPAATRDALFQVDAFRPAALTLPAALRAHLVDTIRFLARFTGPAPDSRLERFREAFRNRFGDRSIPLLVALDAEVGVPYGQHVAAVAPLLEGLDLNPPNAADAEPSLSPAEQRLLSRVWEAIDSKEDEVSLDGRFFEPSPENGAVHLPPTMSIAFSVLSPGEPCRLIVRGIGGATAAAVIGRFAHLDQSILDQLTGVASHESSELGDRVIADLLHLPEDRIGNVLLHPRFRHHEIPCLARAAAPSECIVVLDDLSLSAPHSGRIRLWSSRLKREVVPMLGNAHRYDAVELLPVYRLLADLQVQGAARGLALPIERLLRFVPRIPRVVYGCCVVSPAIWRLAGETLAAALQALQGGAIEARKWREMQQLPQRVRLALSDHELYLDLGNDRCRDLLGSELRGKREVLLVEDLFNSDRAWTRSTDGSHYHEVVATVFSTASSIA